MDSQIEQLPDLAGYLKFASVPDWQQVTLSAPNSPDCGQTRDEARSNWQRWRADQAANTVPPDVDNVRSTTAAAVRADTTKAASVSETANAAGAATATKREIAARTTIDYGPVITPDSAEYE
jgi:hypothetical protein